jgi:transposase
VIGYILPMRDKQLYQQILGIESPWRVVDVELTTSDEEVRVYIQRKKGVGLSCPQCGKACAGYDTKQREWRHLDTCQFKTILVADIPRTQCPEHGVHQILVPWSEPGSGFTALFERLVIDWLKEANIKAVSERMGLGWSAVDGIMQRAVKRGLARRDDTESIRHIGVDETSFQKRHEYITVVCDHGRNRVLYLADDRKTTSLNGFYESLSDKQKAGIESASMDMWPAFINATRKHIPDADSKISFDHFHVTKMFNDVIDKVRRAEHKSLFSDGDNSMARSRYDWLKRLGNVSRKRRPDFKALRSIAIKTARAWAIKEHASSLWNYVSRAWAEKGWKKLLGWMSRSRLPAMVKLAKTIRKHLWGIINAIVLDASNGKSESMNSRIQKVKARSHGFRNRERFRNAIYFHLGDLNLYPEPKGTTL